MTYRQHIYLALFVLALVCIYVGCRWHFWGVGSKMNDLDTVAGSLFLLLVFPMLYGLWDADPRTAREISSVKETVGSPNADRVAD